jgi:hypothetical protein
MKKATLSSSSPKPFVPANTVKPVRQGQPVRPPASPAAAGDALVDTKKNGKRPDSGPVGMW